MKALSALAGSQTLLPLLLVSFLSPLGSTALAQQPDGQDSLAAQLAELAQAVRRHQAQIDEQRRLLELQAEVLQDLRHELAQAKGEMELAARPLGWPQQASWRTAVLMNSGTAPALAAVTPATPSPCCS